MVALNHQRIQRRLWDLERGPGGSLSRDIAMDDHAIVLDSDKAGVFGLLPGRVKPGSAEPDVERLPLARRATGVLERRRASHSFAVDPTLINRAAVVYTRFLHAVAVQNLNLIEAVHVDAGIRLGGDAELQVQLHVAELLVRDVVGRSSGRSVGKTFGAPVPGVRFAVPGVPAFNGAPAFAADP